MSEPNYSKREIDQLFSANRNEEKSEHQMMSTKIDEVNAKGDAILKQVKYTNGKVKLHTKIFLMVGTGGIVFMMMKAPELSALLIRVFAGV